MKGKLMKGFMGGSGSAVWEDKYLSAFGGNAWPFILWADRFLKPEVEKLINRSKMSVEKTPKPRNILFVVQWCLYEYLAPSAGSSSQCSIIQYIFLICFFCLGMHLKIDQDHICFKTFVHLHVISEKSKFGWAKRGLYMNEGSQRSFC